jgi:hypothetical protein
VIRPIWIAALCLAGLGGLFATRVTASISEGAVRDPATVGTSFAQDTLAKADRLDLTYLRYPAENIPVAPTEPIAAEIVPTKPAMSAKTASPRPPSPSVHRNAVMLPKPRPKIRPAKNAKDVANGVGRSERLSSTKWLGWHVDFVERCASMRVMILGRRMIGN